MNRFRFNFLKIKCVKQILYRVIFLSFFIFHKAKASLLKESLGISLLFNGEQIKMQNRILTPLWGNGILHIQRNSTTDVLLRPLVYRQAFNKVARNYLNSDKSLLLSHGETFYLWLDSITLCGKILSILIGPDMSVL